MWLWRKKRESWWPIFSTLFAPWQQLWPLCIRVLGCDGAGRVVFKDSPCVSCPSGESSGSRGCLSELSLFLSRVYIFEKYRIDAESMRKKSAKVALKLWPTCGYFVRLSNFYFWVLIRNKVCKNYLRYFSLSMQEKSTLFTRRRSRKTWWPFFLSTKDIVPSIEPISAVASYLPTLSSQRSSTAPGACMSAETRVLGVNLILLPSRFPRQGRLAVPSHCPRWIIVSLSLLIC